MSMKIGIRAWIDFAIRNIFGKPGDEVCFISLLNAVLRLPHSVVSVEYSIRSDSRILRRTSSFVST